MALNSKILKVYLNLHNLKVLLLVEAKSRREMLRFVISDDQNVRWFVVCYNQVFWSKYGRKVFFSEKSLYPCTVNASYTTELVVELATICRVV